MLQQSTEVDTKIPTKITTLLETKTRGHTCRQIGEYVGLNNFSLPEGTSSGCNGIDASAILYPCGNRRSKELRGNGDGVSGKGERGGGVSSIIAGGYRLRKCLMEGVNDPRFDNRTG
jgi:hypothetical protein